MFEGVVSLHVQLIGFSPSIALGCEEFGDGRISCQSLKVNEPLGSRRLVGGRPVWGFERQGSTGLAIAGMSPFHGGR
jgi:hypothetical protein